MATEPFIPRTITVHLGPPGSDARNVTVDFPDYIKNVASSELYPTWPENALRANIYAIITFALNRIYTEHYRSKGYNFDITNSTQYDQAFVPDREIFANISQIVDDIFNDYVVFQDKIQPYFTQYCSGRGTNCRGLKQWGTVDLANQGMTPLEILRYFYGDVHIVENAPIRTNIESYPGRPLRMGSIGEDVRTIQRELNRIALNYPAIPVVPVDSGVFDAETENAVRTFQRIFNLTQDGIVGKDTWYKIKYIYNSVKQLSELYGEGITLAEIERRYPELLREGSQGAGVRVIQYYLNFISFFLDNPWPQLAADGIFGPNTKNAVIAFQNYYGLTPDGIVGRDTWNALQNSYLNIYNNLPSEYKQFISLIYPGNYITVGSRGNTVEQLQRMLQTISINNPDVPYVAVDGVYGDQTKNAVMAIQRLFGFEPIGAVGPLTWNAIVQLYQDYTG